MAKKREIKRSEARILIFLLNADTPFKYGRMIAHKLRIDYGYLNGILAGLRLKGWVGKTKVDNKVFYNVLEKAPKLEELNEAL